MIRLGHHVDPRTLEPTSELVVLDPDHLTRHAVCVGMTGSGKTGLCIGLVEDVAGSGVPVLCLDPKGDLADLLLVSAGPDPAAIARWLPPEPGGPPPEARAAALAARWRAGLAEAGLDEDEVRRWKARVEVVVHTPGSEAGVPVDVLTALTRAPDGLAGDPEGLREYVTGAVGALLGLVGRAGSPLTDPAAILLARLLGDAFAEGRDLPLDELLPQVVDPPFDRLGYFSVEDFFPRSERMALALALNAVVASPAFAPWRQGEPLDVGAWLTPRDGRTPVRVLYLAHLDDAQRMFFVTLLLHAVLAWSRRQPGTSRLRALLFFDEVFGFLPPHPKDPPSKAPVITLMKQARAVGFGVVLATQNPVDADYKAFSNAAAWYVGCLQTRQDRERVVEGLVAAGGGLDAALLDDLVGQLPPRTFVVRVAGGGSARLVRTRTTRAYLRGPLTRQELAALGPPRPPVATPRGDGTLGAPPPAPEGLEVRWLAPEVAGAPTGGPYRPGLLARVRLDGAATGSEPAWRLWFPLDDPDAPPRAVALGEDALRRRAPGRGRYAPLPGWLDERREVRAAQRALAATIPEVVLERWEHRSTGHTSAPGESREAFLGRVEAALAPRLGAALARVEAQVAREVDEARRWGDEARAVAVAASGADREARARAEHAEAVGAIDAVRVGSARVEVEALWLVWVGGPAPVGGNPGGEDASVPSAAASRR